MSSERQDVYTRITDKIIADLEQGVRTWMKPWNAGNTAGRITRPLRHNGVPYYRGDRAFYSLDGDYIQMPVIEAFRDAEGFYSTLARQPTGRGILPVSTAASAVKPGATKAMPAKNS